MINVGPNLVKKFTWRESKEILLMYHGGALMVTGNADVDEPPIIPDILLTTAGKELSRFVQCILNMEYLQAFSNFLRSEKCQLYYLEGVVLLPGGRLWYANRIPIESEPEQADGDTT